APAANPKPNERVSTATTKFFFVIMFVTLLLYFGTGIYFYIKALYPLLFLFINKSVTFRILGIFLLIKRTLN
ncbi:hypothetical protein, partial [Paenibacillus alvei]|uniref:hypothetical protein n=1 Tax=Paenibacillus alvei TaxID=44250 RepID=UPI001C112FD6